VLADPQQRGRKSNPAPLPDRAEVLRTLPLLYRPRQVVELRLLDVVSGPMSAPFTMSGYFDDFDKLADCAVRHSLAAKGAYVTLNPLNPDLLARTANRLIRVGKNNPLTKDQDILRRLWLPLDFDPVRLAGVSSTDEEHSAAIDRARKVRSFLHAEGWPIPILADSGNGGHLLYRIDHPAHDEGLIQKCLSAVAAKFDDERVTIDPAVFNPSRIWKLYGTISRKGDHTQGRPHRLSRILEAA